LTNSNENFGGNKTALFVGFKRFSGSAASNAIGMQKDIAFSKNSLISSAFVTLKSFCGVEFEPA